MGGVVGGVGVSMVEGDEGGGEGVIVVERIMLACTLDLVAQLNTATINMMIQRDIISITDTPTIEAVTETCGNDRLDGVTVIEGRGMVDDI